MEPLRVFVYGTLKPGGFYWSRFCQGKVTSIEPAWISGSLYDLEPGYPGFIESPSRKKPNTPPPGKVLGCVLTFRQDASEKVLRELDWLEGYTPGNRPAYNEYNRECKTPFQWNIPPEAMEQRSPAISHRDFTYSPLEPAFTYVMSESKIAELGGIEVPSGWWPHCMSV